MSVSLQQLRAIPRVLGLFAAVLCAACRADPDANESTQRCSVSRDCDADGFVCHRGYCIAGDDVLPPGSGSDAAVSDAAAADGGGNDGGGSGAPAPQPCT